MLFFYFYNSGWERWPFRIEISSFCKRNYLTQALLSNTWAFFFLCSNDWKFYKLVFLLNPRNIFFFFGYYLAFCFDQWVYFCHWIIDSTYFFAETFCGRLVTGWAYQFDTCTLITRKYQLQMYQLECLEGSFFHILKHFPFLWGIN